MKYKLTEAINPVIDGKKIVKDPGVGGIKLVYSITTNDGKTSTTFIKPFKRHIAESKDKCVNKGDWGNTNNPLSNIWYKTTYNYLNFVKEYKLENIEFLMSLERITDQELISYLNKQTKEFFHGKSNTPVKLTVKQKTLLFIESLISNFKK